MEKGEQWLPHSPRNRQADGMGDEVGDPYPSAKFYYYPIRGLRSSPPPLSRSVGRVQSDSAS